MTKNYKAKVISLEEFTSEMNSHADIEIKNYMQKVIDANNNTDENFYYDFAKTLNCIQITGECLDTTTDFYTVCQVSCEYLYKGVLTTAIIEVLLEKSITEINDKNFVLLKDLPKEFIFQLEDNTDSKFTPLGRFLALQTTTIS